MQFYPHIHLISPTILCYYHQYLMDSVMQKFLTLVPILRKTSVITFSFGTRTSFLNSSNVVCCSRPVGNPLSHSRASLVAQMVKNLPIFWETWFNPWVEKIPLEKKMDTHSSILAWKIPWTDEPGGLQSMGLQRIGHDWAPPGFYVSKKYMFAMQTKLQVILQPCS